MLKRLLFVLHLFICFHASYGQVSYSELKAALTIQFAKNITWQNEDKLSEFKIGFYGSDTTTYNSINSLASITKIKNKPISLNWQNNLNKVDNIQILFVDEKASSTVEQIYKVIETKNILLVTENCSDKKYIMLNIIHSMNKESITFEINKANIIIEDLIIEPELLLLGGTDIDVRELFRNMKKELEVEQEKKLQQDRKIENQLKDINKYKGEIKDYEYSVDSLHDEIYDHSNKLNKLSEKITNQQKVLDEKIIALDIQEKKLENQSDKLKKQKFDISSKEENLKKLNNEIDKNNSLISEQESIIDSKDDLLKANKRFLYISIGFALAVLALGISIFRAFTIKRRSNIILEEQVQLRTKELVEEIEQRKKSERELYKSEKRYKQTFNHAPIGIAEVTSEKFLRTNQHIQEIFGYSGEELLNLGYKDLTHPDYIGESKEILKIMSKNPDEIRSLKKKYIRKDGKEIWCLSTITGVTSDLGKLLHFIITVKDVTKEIKIQKELEKYRNHLEKLVKERTLEIEKINERLVDSNEELLSANEELERRRNEIQKTLDKLSETQSKLVQAEKMASVGVLTAGVAHEINNPLNFIYGGITGIDKFFDKEGLKEHRSKVEVLINGVKEGVERVSKIVKSLNNFSRKDVSVNNDCDIHYIIDNCLVMLQYQLKHKTEIKKEFTNKNLHIKGNEGQLHQAILNIIANANQAIEKDGLITIKTDVEDNKFVLEIKDNGSGIHDKDLSKIFDPFFTTKDPGKGTGMGLSITYNIIKRHHGELEFESKLNEGTKAIIKLPISN